MDESERFDEENSATVKVYDRQESLRRLRGSEELLHDMARFFHEDAPKLLAQLKHALTENDNRVVSRVAHTLRGLAATFDAYAAMEAAERLETLGNKDERQQFAPAARDLEAEVWRLDHALAGERMAGEHMLH